MPVELKNRYFYTEFLNESQLRKQLYKGLIGILCIWECLAAGAAYGQQNEALAYIELGSATPVRQFNYGMAAEAGIRLSPQVRLDAGFRLANQYPSGLGDLKAGATIFLKKDSDEWICQNAVVFSNYAPYPMSQLYYRLTFAWESKYFRIDFGNAFACYVGSGVIKYHLLRPSFSVRGNIRGKGSPWNIALFIRNFNRFEAHGSKCVEWGGEFSATVAKRWRVFCEPYVVTAGNFNGTATFYNFNCLLGGAYLW